eukprot:CAMPEP_0205928832 /NCGR_PEP_ID=MMETSP1325-20131115/24959_1 /ASSEMBLY_ACC=CAM_ASM_000708 /TAXON_ID=236786 /ORGANISM="Florenciella sp., Strain RCC1007" /LENGTH=123 /DNA_ID=CAMNT_0053297951 /DNA_START=274 /DNA_END=642 /DNA_ORIENTATION=+
MYRNPKSFSLQSDDDLKMLGLEQPVPLDDARRERFCMSGSDSSLSSQELRGGPAAMEASGMVPSVSSQSLLGGHMSLLGIGSSGNLAAMLGDKSRDERSDNARAERYCVDGQDELDEHQELWR